MRRFFIGGNWKCNNTVAQTETLVKDVYNKLAFDPKKGQVIASPVFVHLPWVQKNLTNNVEVAAQNASLTKMGAYTGEISVEHLKDMNVPWVIIGHSERRTYYGETDQLVGQKCKKVLDGGLSVIACFGERIEERQSNKTIDVVKAQLDAIKKELTNEQWKNVVLAYEPVWAIGTGVVATTDQAQEVHDYVRKYLAENVSADVSKNTRIIYGGSVSDANAVDLAKQQDVDGFLVGGASLKPAFKQVVDAFNNL